MTTYMVTWKMEFDAKNPLRAAELAVEAHHDPDSLASCFEVYDIEDPEKKVTYVDALMGLTANTEDGLMDQVKEAL